MIDICKDAGKIGSTRGIQNPNDPRLTGTYKDPVESISEQQRSVLSTVPVAPPPQPFKSFRE